MADSFQPIPQAAQTAAYPDLTRHRVASRFRCDELLDGGDNTQIFFLVGGRPAPGWRTRSTGRSTREPANSTRPRRIVFSSTAGNVEQNTVGAIPQPLGFHGQIPAPLLLV
jgi:hypothetical protein